MPKRAGGDVREADHISPVNNMRNWSISTALAFVSLALSHQAYAQTCLGLPDLKSARAVVGASVATNNGVNGVAGHLTIGGERAFVGGTVSYTDDSDADLHAIGGSAIAALSLPIVASSRLRACPFVELGYTHGPNDETDEYSFTSSTLGAYAGVAVGNLLDLGSNLGLAPNFQIGAISRKFKTSVSAGQFSVSDRTSEFGGQASVGVGVIFSRVLSIQPSVAVPIGFGKADAIYSLGISVGFSR